MTTMPRWFAAATIMVTLVLTGCTAAQTIDDQPSPTTTRSLGTPTARAADTPVAAPPRTCIDYVSPTVPVAAAGDAVAAAAATAVLPPTVVLNPGMQIIASVDEPGMLDVVARVCSEPMTEAEVIDVATTIAAAIYADPSHESVSTLTVSSWHPLGQSLEQGETVTTDDYQLYLWDNTTGALRAAWQ